MARRPEPVDRRLRARARPDVAAPQARLVPPADHGRRVRVAAVAASPAWADSVAAVANARR